MYWDNPYDSASLQHVDVDGQVITLHGSMIDYAITTLQVLYAVLMLCFAVLVFTNTISPLAAGAMGLAACTLVIGWKLLRRKRRRLAAAQP